MTIERSGVVRVERSPLSSTGFVRTTYDADGEVIATEEVTPASMPALPADPLLDADDPRDTTTIRRT